MPSIKGVIFWHLCIDNKPNDCNNTGQNNEQWDELVRWQPIASQYEAYMYYHSRPTGEDVIPVFMSPNDKIIAWYRAILSGHKIHKSVSSLSTSFDTVYIEHTN